MDKPFWQGAPDGYMFRLVALSFFAVLLFTVFAAIDLFFFISQEEDMGQLLFDGSDASGIVTFDHVFDLLGQNQLPLVYDLTILDHIDSDVMIDEC